MKDTTVRFVCVQCSICFMQHSSSMIANISYVKVKLDRLLSTAPFQNIMNARSFHVAMWMYDVITNISSVTLACNRPGISGVHVYFCKFASRCFFLEACGNNVG
jgi:hypothetical protein